jgi:predicted dehydrogenase
MNHPVTRRHFLEQSTRLATGALAAGSAASFKAIAGANDRVLLGIMGTNSRGADLARGFLSVEGFEIAYICDVDDRAIRKGLAPAADKQSRQPKAVKDFRRILEDRDVDALVIAAPDHWHAPATILACAAGKHVYVEKPASHNPRDGELAVAAARKYNRVVQVGTQRRSMPGVVEAIQKVRSGAIGRVLFSRSWYNSTRGSIGRGKAAPVPEWLDWDLWQGPAPERPYRDNIVHYNWHWFWHWGTGELGNNGIHGLDLCRWGLGVDYPRRITAGGGRYHFSDDQETPDTHIVSFDFGDKAIAWEGRSCQRHGTEDSMFGSSFHGDNGTLVTDGTGYKLYDAADKLVEKVSGSGGDSHHLLNFLECIRTGKRPNADIEEGHKSTLLCHLGNIAYRTGHTINLDPSTPRIVGDEAASRLWTRDYRRGWEPKV